SRALVIVEDRDPPSRVGLRLLTRHGQSLGKRGARGAPRKSVAYPSHLDSICLEFRQPCGDLPLSRATGLRDRRYEALSPSGPRGRASRWGWGARCRARAAASPEGPLQAPRGVTVAALDVCGTRPTITLRRRTSVVSITPETCRGSRNSLHARAATD